MLDLNDSKIPTVLKLIEMLDQHGSFLYSLVNPLCCKIYISVFHYNLSKPRVDQPVYTLNIVLLLKVESLGRSGSNITGSRNLCLERKDTIFSPPS